MWFRAISNLYQTTQGGTTITTTTTTATTTTTSTTTTITTTTTTTTTTATTTTCTRLLLLQCLWFRAISNLYYLMGKFGIRDRGEIRSTATFDQLEKVNPANHFVIS